MFSRLALEQPNVLVLDEPTNHLDLESIEALVAGLQNYEGTLILVSHDRWFVGQLATRVVEISSSGIRDYHGTYEEYVHACGDDHLDADTVVLKAKREEKKAEKSGPVGNGSRPPAQKSAASSTLTPHERRRLEARRDEITADIERAEARVAEIDALYASPGFFADTAPEQLQKLQAERAATVESVEKMMEEWESVESRLGAGVGSA